MLNITKIQKLNILIFLICVLQISCNSKNIFKMNLLTQSNKQNPPSLEQLEKSSEIKSSEINPKIPSDAQDLKIDFKFETLEIKNNKKLQLKNLKKAKNEYKFMSNKIISRHKMENLMNRSDKLYEKEDLCCISTFIKCIRCYNKCCNKSQLCPISNCPYKKIPIFIIREQIRLFIEQSNSKDPINYNQAILKTHIARLSLCYPCLSALLMLIISLTWEPMVGILGLVLWLGGICESLSCTHFAYCCPDHNPHNKKFSEIYEALVQECDDLPQYNQAIPLHIPDSTENLSDINDRRFKNPSHSFLKATVMGVNDLTSSVSNEEKFVFSEEKSDNISSKKGMPVNKKIKYVVKQRNKNISYLNKKISRTSIELHMEKSIGLYNKKKCIHFIKYKRIHNMLCNKCIYKHMYLCLKKTRLIYLMRKSRAMNDFEEYVQFYISQDPVEYNDATKTGTLFRLMISSYLLLFNVFIVLFGILKVIGIYFGTSCCCFSEALCCYALSVFCPDPNPRNDNLERLYSNMLTDNNDDINEDSEEDNKPIVL